MLPEILNNLNLSAAIGVAVDTCLRCLVVALSVSLHVASDSICQTPVSLQVLTMAPHTDYYKVVLARLASQCSPTMRPVLLVLLLGSTGQATPQGSPGNTQLYQPSGYQASQAYQPPPVKAPGDLQAFLTPWEGPSLWTASTSPGS